MCQPLALGVGNFQSPEWRCGDCLGVEDTACMLGGVGLQLTTSMAHGSQMHLTVSHALKVAKRWRKGYESPSEFCFFFFKLLICGMKQQNDYRECHEEVKEPVQRRTKE